MHGIRPLSILLHIAILSGCTFAMAAPVVESPAVRSRIGLVLSGGGGRGLAHLGVLKVLEELRVPVDCITGTSMGGIVGGVYASGAPLAEMEQRVRAIDWEGAFRDRPDRRNMRVRQKIAEETGYLAQPEFGFNRIALQVPAGILYGQKLEKLFADLAFRADGVDDFSQLPIPFKAVSTDIATGHAVVLEKGALWQSMRATMSIPGVMAPVNMEGKSLLDGGLVNNLPVDLARQMCADVVIAVNLGSPLLKRDEIHSMFDVSEQMIQILTEQNVQAALASLKPSDVLISPELGDIRTSSFDRVDDTITSGEVAARKVAAALRALSMPETEYAVWRQRQQFVPKAGRKIDAIRLAPMKHANPEFLLASIRLDAKNITRESVESEAQVLYDRGDFQRVGVRYLDEDGKRIAVIEPEEKTWGPDFLRFGLNLSADLTGSTHYNVLLRHNQTWLNRYAGEWSNQVQLGQSAAFVSEFHQPLGLNSAFFVAPRISFLRNTNSLFSGDSEVAQLTSRSLRGAVDVGRELGKSGEVRVGAVRGYLNAQGIVGVPVNSASYELGGWVGRLSYDVLDTVDFPRAGSAGQLDGFMSRRVLGASQHYDRVEFNWMGATTWRQNTVQLALRGGRPLGENPLPIYDAFSLGGFQMLSGYPQDRFRSQEIRYGRISMYRNIPPLLALNLGGLLEKFHIGATFETAQINRSFDARSPDGQYRSASLFIGAKTMLGPAYLSYGRSDSGNNTVWLTVGRTWMPR